MHNEIPGRGTILQLPNRFLQHHLAKEHPEAIDSWEADKRKTEFFKEYPKKILNKITSPDIPLSYSLNPYQGCEHGCIYCYARNSHAYWGYNSGLEFEQKIIVKPDAPRLLEQLFNSKKWNGEPISLSGNTDCYQPAERHYQITRQILELCLKHRNPVGIITKNKLILRDLDILIKLNERNLISVFISITGTDEKNRRRMEPRTSTYLSRFKTIQELSENGIPTGIMHAPVIPGMNDQEMYNVLRLGRKNGAKFAGYTIVRLNGDLDKLFTDWLENHYPDRKEKVLNMIRSCHNGHLNNSEFGHRMKGGGRIAELIHQQFKRYCRLFHLNEEEFVYNRKDFIRNGQLRLF